MHITIVTDVMRMLNKKINAGKPHTELGYQGSAVLPQETVFSYTPGHGEGK
uniref:Uncharacterized protein n=1 Tax=Arion vulgaris TaxID=1028688 RepID=A0A0B7AUF8_9EUPU